MDKVWLVVESDWESSVALEAWSTEEKADARAKELDAKGRASAKRSAIWGIGVEDVPFDKEYEA